MPCLFVKCKRAVDRVSPEKLPWWIAVHFNIVKWVMVVSLPFLTATFEMWGQSYGLFSVCEAAEESEAAILVLTLQMTQFSKYFRCHQEMQSGLEQCLCICAWSGLHPRMALCLFLFSVPPCIITLNCLSVVAVCRGVNAPCCVSACLPCWPVCQDQATSPFSFFLTRRWTLDFRNVSDVLSAGCG